ncbi:amidohydrolase family protein [Egibacter rhizosphaerae]|uniref:amidohydrolase family protein n=1 Tax=Egibacter rhizosphaerae TaxID=1670831 RepID=UPI00197A86BC|nr:amidohydrolase family protein [Egibacter rhizosphaerae]
MDIHHHVGTLDVGASADGAPWTMERDLEARLALMERYAVDAAALMPAFHFERREGPRSVSRANDRVAQYQRLGGAEQFPIALGTVDPLMGEDESVAEMRRMRDELGMAGVVWHHRFQNVYMSDERMDPLLRTAEAFGWPVFLHVFPESTMEAPWTLEKWLERFPGVTFVALDSLMAFTQSRYLLSLGHRYDNVLFETAGAFPVGRLIRSFVRELGAHRVIYGSDLYMSPPTYDSPSPLLEIRASDLTPVERHEVLVGDFLRLFELEGA